MQIKTLLALAALGYALPQDPAPPAPTGAPMEPAPQAPGGEMPQGGAPMNQMSQGGQQMSQGGQMMQGGQMGGMGVQPGQPGGVPMDLAGGFKPQMITVQTSFMGDAAQNPLMSGQMVQQQQCMSEPKFALGKGSMPKPGAMWVMMVVDTTQMGNRMLHMVKADYKVDGQQMQIKSQSQPKMQYMAPGMLGEQGQNRQYTFLMYAQKANFPGKNMPQPGKPVVMKDFVQANGLDKAVAGMSMMVNVQPMQNMGGQPMSQGGQPMSQGGQPMSQGGQQLQGGSQTIQGGMAGGAPGAQQTGMVGGAPGAPGAPGAQQTGMAGGMMAGGTGAPGAMGTGMPGGVAGGMMNGSNPSIQGGAQPTQPPPDSASGTAPKPSSASGAANANKWNAAAGLGAVGLAAIALI